MKKIILLLATAGALNFTSCKDFLTVVPSDALFLEDVNSLRLTLAPALKYFKNNNMVSEGASQIPGAWLDFQMGNKYTAYSDVWTFHSWYDENLSESQRRLMARAVINESDWSIYYKIIGFMNLILVQIDDAPGDDIMRNYVKGEALLHRANAFYKLLQYYSPIDDASLGVPVYLDIYGGFDDADLSRKSQSQVFDRILGDIGEAERLLGITNPDPVYNAMYNPNLLYRLKAQVYHWKASGPAAKEGDWGRAAEAAKEAIARTGNELPLDVQQLEHYYNPPINWADLSTLGQVNKGGLPEFGVSGEKYHNGGYGGLFKDSYDYNPVLYDELYLDADYRKTFWFNTSGSTIAVVKQKPTFAHNKFLSWGFRLSEQYLILIEALAHTGEFTDGLGYLRLWQSVRYNTALQTEWPNPTNADELLEEVLKERKREFVCEGDYHWLDMKRFRIAEDPLNPSRVNKDYTAPTLTADDLRYSFMIPDSETDTNSGIKQNPGWSEYRFM